MNYRRNPLRRRGITIAAAAVAMSVGVAGLPVVALDATPAAVAAEWPSTGAWNEANMIAADAIAGNYSLAPTRGQLNGIQNSIWGYVSYADRANMEADDYRSNWSDTRVPTGIPVYMRYEKADGTMSRIHKAVTHHDRDGNTVYSFKRQDGPARLNAGTDKLGSGDVQVMIGENNVIQHPITGEYMTVIRSNPGGDPYSGSIEKSVYQNISIHPSHGASNRTWGELQTKMYMTSPATHLLKTQLSDSPNKRFKGTYSGRVWSESMGANDVENFYSNFTQRRDNGPTFDSADTPAEGFVVYQAVPNEEAFRALLAIRESVPNHSRRTNKAAWENMIHRMSAYVADNPQNFTVYKSDVGSGGRYVLRTSFDRPQHADFIYMWVENDEGVASNLSAWTTPEFRSPTGAASYSVPGNPSRSDYDYHRNGHVPTQGRDYDGATQLSSTTWSNVHFALGRDASGSVHIIKPGVPDGGTYDAGYQPTTVAQGGTATVPAPKAANGNDLPAGTTYRPAEGVPAWATVNENGTIDLAPGYDVAPGNYNIPVVVAYPNGTSETIQAPVTVTAADAWTYSPQYDDTSKRYDEALTVPAPRDPNRTLPSGTTFAPTNGTQPEVTVNQNGTIDVPANSLPVGNHSIPVLVTYPDGSSETIEARVTVTDATPDAEEYQPGYAETVISELEPLEVDAPQDIDGKDLPAGTTFESVPRTPRGVTVNPDGSLSAEPGTLPVGDHNIPVRVVYPDNSTEIIYAPVKVTPSNANEYQPQYRPSTKAWDEDLTVPAPTERDGKTIPAGTTYGPGEDIQQGVTVNPDGTIDVPARSLAVGRHFVPVLVTYPDNSSETIYAQVTVTPLSAEYNPGYQPGTGEPGQSVTVPQTGEPQLPPGTSFEIDDPRADINPETGEVTINIPEDAQPGDTIETPVTVTYPDDSTDHPTVTIVVTEPKDQDLPDSDTYNPGYAPVSGEPGQEITSPQTRDDNLPEDTEFSTTYPGADIDPVTGEITFTIPEDAVPGRPILIPVVVTYPDGTEDTPIAVVNVTEPGDLTTDADQHNPSYTPVAGEQGETVHSPQTGDEELPEGTEFSTTYPGADIDPVTGEITFRIPEDTTPSALIYIPVTVTYPDGSVDTPEAIVIVLPKTETGEPSPGEDIPVPQAEEFNPGYDGGRGEPGTTVNVPQTGEENLPEGTTFTTDHPGANIDPVTGDITYQIPEDAQPGEVIEVPVTVTYPDESTEQITAEITVTEPEDDGPAGPTDAQANDPGYDPVSGRPGTEVTSPQTGDTDLPEGTTFTTDHPGANIDPVTGDITYQIPEDARPGDIITIPVVVVYPDESVDRPNAQVFVVTGQAEQHNPGYAPGKGQPGAQVEMPQSGDTNLPEGTVFETDHPRATIDPVTGDIVFQIPEGAQPGNEFEIDVVVTYPDGSVDRPVARVTVIPEPTNQAEENNPGYAPHQGQPGQTVNAPQSGDRDLPSGTVFTTDHPGADIDPVTGDITYSIPRDAQPGDVIDIPVTVTYPDSSVDQPVLEITVIALPDWNDQTTTPGQPVVVPNEGGPVQPGSTVETEGPGTAALNPDGSITVTPGPDAQPGDTITVTVKDPEGNVIDEFDVTIEEDDPGADQENPDWGDGSGYPGATVTIPNEGGPTTGNETVIVIDGPGTADIDENGNLIVDINDDATPGDTIVVEVRDGDGEVIATVTVTVIERFAVVPPVEGSVNMEQCLPAIATVGLPLLLLIPLGLATQVNIPGLEPLTAQVNQALEEANARLQQSLGIFEEEAASWASRFNAELGGVAQYAGQAAAGIALVTAGLLAGWFIYDNCTPGDPVIDAGSAFTGSSGSTEIGTQPGGETQSTILGSSADSSEGGSSADSASANGDE